jgi:hypothetical protein
MNRLLQLRETLPCWAVRRKFQKHLRSPRSLEEGLLPRKITRVRPSSLLKILKQMFPMHQSPRRNKAFIAQGVLALYGILVIFISYSDQASALFYKLIIRLSDIIRTSVFKSPPVMCGALYGYIPF